MFDLYVPEGVQLPLCVSSPHTGTRYPDQVPTKIKQRFIDCPEDTDWDVDRLFGEIIREGALSIKPHFSRYLIDLNRAVVPQKLYDDGRLQLDLVPLQSFAGEALYPAEPPDQAEQSLRIIKYYKPYHEALQTNLDRLKTQFGYALLVEAHSIKRHVPLIVSKPLTDVTIGTDYGKSLPLKAQEVAAKTLRAAGLTVQINEPFAGGFITRNYHRENIFTIQFEISQDIYLTAHNSIDQVKSKKLNAIFKNTIKAMIRELHDL